MNMSLMALQAKQTLNGNLDCILLKSLSNCISEDQKALRRIENRSFFCFMGCCGQKLHYLLTSLQDLSHSVIDQPCILETARRWLVLILAYRKKICQLIGKNLLNHLHRRIQGYFKVMKKSEMTLKQQLCERVPAYLKIRYSMKS